MSSIELKMYGPNRTIPSIYSPQIDNTLAQWTKKAFNTHRRSIVVLGYGHEKGIIVESDDVGGDVSVYTVLNQVLHQLVIALLGISQRFLLEEGGHFRVGHLGCVPRPLARQRLMRGRTAFTASRG